MIYLPQNNSITFLTFVIGVNEECVLEYMNHATYAKKNKNIIVTLTQECN